MLAKRFQSSGDLSADRRFAYAQGCLEEGDLAAAIELFEQTVEAAPGFAPAWFELGKARAEAGLPNAADAFARALDLEPDDALGAALHLNRLGASDGENSMRPAYVRRLFDHYAPRFEAHLQDALGYDGPERLFEAVSSVCEAKKRTVRFETMLDLGCGTGLAGVRFSPICETMEGCDLAPAMLEKAAGKQLYHRLEPLDAVAFLTRDHAPVDLILAADVFPYLGDLRPVLRAAAGRLAGDGLLAFSVQSRQGDGFSLGADFRYAHAAAYLERAAHEARLAILSSAPVPVRREHGSDSPGLIIVLAHV